MEPAIPVSHQRSNKANVIMKSTINALPTPANLRVTTHYGTNIGHMCLYITLSDLSVGRVTDTNIPY